MAAFNFQKCYFLSPTRNYPPDRRIRLGNIITSPSLPDEPLNDSAFQIDPAIIDRHTERGWSTTRGKLNETKVGLWASFLQLIVGIGGDVDVGNESKRDQTFSCARVVTDEFNPSFAFLQECIKSPSINKVLQEKRDWYFFTGQRKKVYMITGLKIAYGASQVFEESHKHNVHLHLGVDGTSAGVPLAAGPNLDVTRGTTEGESFSGSDAFILGFRLRAIKLDAVGDVKHKAFVDGATLGKEDEREKEEEPLEIVVQGLASEDARGAEFRKDEFIVVDEENDSEYLCVNPT